MKKNLHQFLDSFCSTIRLRDVKRAFTSVHQKYEGKERGGLSSLSSKMLVSYDEHVAYMLYRMPATYAAVGEALKHIKETLPGFCPKTILDLGSGPGTALLAAFDLFPSLEKGVGLERNEIFLGLAKDCFAFFEEKRAEVKEWPLEQVYPDTPVDIVIASYCFSELEEVVRKAWVQWAKKNAKVLVLVEPGTPRGWDVILSLRQEKRILAPCPHGKACPMQEEGRAWCHQSVRLSRTHVHKYLKEGDLGYEDEKFCYLGLLCDDSVPVSIPACRIVNTPRHRGGHTYLSLCTQKGSLETCIVSRKRKELYALAKRARWGESFPIV